MIGMTERMTKLPGLLPLVADRNLTAVAKAIDMDASQFYLIAKQHRGASLASALKIADYFGTTVEDLVKQPDVAPTEVTVAC